jgi:hypothetical protein
MMTGENEKHNDWKDGTSEDSLVAHTDLTSLAVNAVMTVCGDHCCCLLCLINSWIMLGQ